jgi:hypothetical protein
MQRVLLTGAAGDVGRRITPLLKAIYPGLMLSDVKPVADTFGLPFIQADLAVATEVRGTRSSTPILSAAIICLRKHAAQALRASSLPRPITPSATTHAARRSRMTFRYCQTAVTECPKPSVRPSAPCTR